MRYVDKATIINHEDINVVFIELDRTSYNYYPFSYNNIFELLFQKMIYDIIFECPDNKYTLNLDKCEILVELSDNTLNKRKLDSCVVNRNGKNITFDGSINDLINYLEDKNSKTFDIDFNIYMELDNNIEIIQDGKHVSGDVLDINVSSITYNMHDLSKFTINYSKNDIEVREFE